MAVVHLNLPRRLRAPAHLVFQPAEAQTFGAIEDQKRRHAARPLVARARHHDIGVRIAAPRDKGLGPGQSPAVVGTQGPGADRRGVRAGPWFGQAIGEHRLHANRLRQNARLHLVRAIGVDHAGDHVVNRKKRRDAGAGPRKRLEDQRCIKPRQPCAASFLADVKAAKAQFGDLAPKFLGNCAFALPVTGMGRDAILSKAARSVENEGLLLAQREIHGFLPGIERLSN